MICRSLRKPHCADVSQANCSLRAWSIALAVGAANLLGANVPAQAAPTGAPLWGITGTSTLPSTQTVPRQQIEMGLSYENVDPATSGRVEFYPIVTATYGLKKGEVGVGILREDVSTSLFNLNFKNSYQTIHGKYRFYEDAKRRVDVAVGAHYLNFGSIDGDVLSFYGVASKSLLRPDSRYTLLGNVGILHQRIGGANSASETRPFIGADFGLNRKVSFVGDFTPRAGQAVKIYSLAARYQANEHLALQLGLGQFRGTDEKYFFGASYRFNTQR